MDVDRGSSVRPDGGTSAILFPTSVVGGGPLRVALVNNMPDSAFVDTEDQFRRATEAGMDGVAVELELYAIEEIPRSEAIASVIRSRYRGLDELWARPPDAMVVTGTEPTDGPSRDEPCWPYLARLLEWAADSVPTTLLSCLAAHVSVSLFDGIERVRRPVKCSGVFRGRLADRSDPLARGLPELVPVPHSRFNEVPESVLVDAGYRIVIGSGMSDAGWAVAARKQGRGLFVLCQGHPEYGRLSLLREYRRDVRRCLFGRGTPPYPRIPEGYLHPGALATLRRFERQAEVADTDPQELWANFPFQEVAPTVQSTWAPAAALLYRNWLRLADAALPLAA
jgi:homoserine O-succinyltransferase/O-acetyltransferase